MRQRISQHHFWDGQEAVDLWQKHGRMFFIIVSYGWLTPEHPDPHCYHLERLLGVIRKLRQCGSKYGIRDVGIVVDFCALWQPDGEPDRRTAKQQREFSEGLALFLAMYGHKHITAVKLTGMPKGTKRG